MDREDRRWAEQRGDQTRTRGRLDALPHALARVQTPSERLLKRNSQANPLSLLVSQHSAAASSAKKAANAASTAASASLIAVKRLHPSTSNQRLQSSTPQSITPPHKYSVLFSQLLDSLCVCAFDGTKSSCSYEAMFSGKRERKGTCGDSMVCAVTRKWLSRIGGWV